MSDYKAPEPELHIPDPDLDLNPEDGWRVVKHCDTCNCLIFLEDRPPAKMWPDLCKDCTDYTECDCPEGMYPVRHSWKSGKMWNTGGHWRDTWREVCEPEMADYDQLGAYGDLSLSFVCEC